MKYKENKLIFYINKLLKLFVLLIIAEVVTLSINIYLIHNKISVVIISIILIFIFGFSVFIVKNVYSNTFIELNEEGIKLNIEYGFLYLKTYNNFISYLQIQSFSFNSGIIQKILKCADLNISDGSNNNAIEFYNLSNYKELQKKLNEHSNQK